MDTKLEEYDKLELDVAVLIADGNTQRLPITLRGNGKPLQTSARGTLWNGPFLMIY